jgi:drug/metabolite transporter (DMT)-like permease
MLHAGWNALSKRGCDPLCFLYLATALATAFVIPAAVWVASREGVSAAALPYVAVTIAVHSLYFVLLSRAYRAGDLSIVYPVARGLGVALVPVLALVFLGERLSRVGTLGVALVVIGIIAIQLADRRWRGLGAPALNPGTAWALATGAMTAMYSLVDKAGVARLHPVPYIGAMFLGMTLVLLPVVLRDARALRVEWTVNRRSIAVASFMTIGGYLLVLFAFRLSKAGYVVAAREVSIVLSAVIGRLWLGELGSARRFVGAAIVLAGVVCVALAR